MSNRKSKVEARSEGVHVKQINKLTLRTIRGGRAPADKLATMSGTFNQ